MNNEPEEEYHCPSCGEPCDEDHCDECGWIIGDETESQFNDPYGDNDTQIPYSNQGEMNPDR